MKLKETIDLSKGPLPDVTEPEGAYFWEGTRKGEIRFPKCRKCNQLHFYPTVLCPFCHSWDIGWQVAKGTPRLYTWGIVRWNLAKAEYSHLYDEQGPFIAALVEFDDAPGLYLPSNIIGCQPEDLKIGMPLEVVFQKINDELTMPLFKPKKDK